MPNPQNSDDSRNQKELSNEFCNVAAIHGFPELFGRPADATKGRRNSVRFGSTLLISGPPGAGKTTFALATVRAMMAEAHRNNQASERQKQKQQKTIAYYISSEVHEEQLNDSFEEFGWFAIRTKADGDGFKFWVDNPEPDKTNFYAITAMAEVDRPVPSPEELVNGIFNRIAHTLVPSEAPLENAKIYIIIDSITALLKGCDNPGEERRQTHEIKRRLLDRFGKGNLALIVLLAEQDHRSQDAGITNSPTSPTEPSVEDYLADVVFRLYVRNLPLGRRSRVLEVVKSQGSIMTLGEHTWQIISEGNYRDVVRHDPFAVAIKSSCLEDPSLGDVSQVNCWGGIVIFSRPRLHRRGPPTIPADSDTTRSDMKYVQGPGSTFLPPKKDWDPKTGTDGLDLNLSPGSITLIAGPMGCGKTTLCEQFLNHHPATKRRALISFDIPTQPAEPVRSAAAPANETNGPPSPNKHTRSNFTTIHFTQTQFDLNVLVSHINWILDDEIGCDRLAFDGLSEWITTFEKPEAARVLEAIMVTVKRDREVGSAPAVFMTYEMPLDDDPLGPAALGAAADNLVVVRKVPINDELRTVIYVLKRSGNREKGGGATPLEYPGELIPNSQRDKLEVNATSLEAFTGLLSRTRKVEPARVLIQLFAENSCEERFNSLIAERLEKQYDKRLELTFTQFNLSEIGSTLETAYGAGKPGESFNLAIHSVDEWWLKEEQNRIFLKDLKASKSSKGPQYHDFWWFEIEKAGDNELDQWHAVPGYLDFGMFCINLQAMDDATRKQYVDPTEGDLALDKRREQWQKILHAVPRLWVKTDPARPDWFQLEESKIPTRQSKSTDASNPETVLDFAVRVTGQQGRKNLSRRHVFAFDSSTRETCACMFFELAWAFGATEDLQLEKNRGPNHAAAKRALVFLQFLVMEGLMPARSSTQSRNHNKTPILFSRQWYSTLQKSEEKKTGELVSLPFMPIGQEAKDAVGSLVDDIAVRQRRWFGRARRYWENRVKPLEPQLTNWKKLEKKWNKLAAKCAELKRTTTWSGRLSRALETYQYSREWLLETAKLQSPEGPAVGAASAKWTPDLDDLMELAGWLAFRLRLLFGNSGGKFPPPSKPGPKKEPDPVTAALKEARWVRHNLPDLKNLKVAKLREEHVVATGYVCSGSWMFGVDAKSRSSEIQAQVLTELTSLDSAEKRADSQAGMPARKDFFYLKGGESIEYMEYLNWREFLRYSGARSRRRDRVLYDPRSAAMPAGSDLIAEESRRDPAELFGTIHREMLACLRIADLYRQEYANDESRKSDGAKTNDAITTVCARAEQAVAAIRAAAQKASQTPDSREPPNTDTVTNS